MIIEKKFCKNCGQKLKESPFDKILGARFIELVDGYYCPDCARKIITKRKETV